MLFFATIIWTTVAWTDCVLSTPVKVLSTCHNRPVALASFAATQPPIYRHGILYPFSTPCSFCQNVRVRPAVSTTTSLGGDAPLRQQNHSGLSHSFRSQPNNQRLRLTHVPGEAYEERTHSWCLLGGEWGVWESDGNTLLLICRGFSSMSNAKAG